MTKLHGLDLDLAKLEVGASLILVLAFLMNRRASLEARCSCSSKKPLYLSGEYFSRNQVSSRWSLKKVHT